MQLLHFGIKKLPHIQEYGVLAETFAHDVADELQRLEEMVVNEPQLALKGFEASLPLFVLQNDPHIHARALRGMGYGDYLVGNSMAAASKLMQAKTLFEQVVDTRQVVGTLLEIGHAFLELGDLEEALNSYENARTQGKSIDYFQGMRTAQRHLGRVLLEFGHFDKALEQFQASTPKPIASDTDRRDLAWTQLYVSRAQLGLYKRDSDVPLANAAYKLSERVRDRRAHV